MIEKPVVYYEGDAVFHTVPYTSKGIIAMVYGIDHPLLGTQLIRTSRVIKQDVDEFETLNTI